jgi:HD-GYP domain-containing protein (c-di-GMP phosphodiesterase class II)
MRTPVRLRWLPAPLEALSAALASGALVLTACKAARVHRTLVDLLLNALTAGDAATARHSRRVADYTDAVANALPLSREEHATLRVGSLLHDMGKIEDRFFDIIHSRKPLTPEQRAEINHHPGESAQILQPLEALHPGIMAIVQSHHECWDGSGYPNGLCGDSIPLGARIITAADVFDALTQTRAYRQGVSFEKAMEELRGDVGNRFDPGVIQMVELPEVQQRWREIFWGGRAEEIRESSARWGTRSAATSQMAPRAASGSSASRPAAAK